MVIRLGENESPIHCDILHSNLADPPRYEALSYTWGSPAECRDIYVNGKAYTVRQNLWCALLHLRSPTTSRCMWIDAICINQDDTRERNHQVAQMSQIYQKAERVVVWLGPLNYSIKSVFDFVTKTSGEPAHHYPAHTLATFCKLEYWQRLWIIQEVLLASKIVLQSGYRCLDWDAFSRIFVPCRNKNVEMLTRHDFKALILQNDPKVNSTVREGVLAQLVLQWEDKSQGSTPSNFPLLRLIFQYREARCEDVRDKVFGLLGLAKSCCSTALKVDYSSSLIDLHQEILRHAAKDHNLEDIIEYFKAARDLGRILCVPLDEENGKLYNLGILYPSTTSVDANDGTKNPWAHSTITFISEPLDPPGSWDAYDIESCRRRYYDASTRMRCPKPRDCSIETTRKELEAINARRKTGIREYSVPYDLHEITQNLKDEYEDRILLEAISRVFLDSNGMAGVAPEDIRIGDIVCQFPDPQYPLIVRKQLDHYEIIAKSANCDSLLSFTTDPDKRNKLKAYDSQGRPVNFYMDRPLLLYYRGLCVSELNFKECADTSALGRTFTRDELQEEYGYGV
jgi:hypothetical protein